jgi:hypothetical protein
MMNLRPRRFRTRNRQQELESTSLRCCDMPGGDCTWLYTFLGPTLRIFRRELIIAWAFPGI